MTQYHPPNASPFLSIRTLLCDTTYQIALLEQGAIPDSVKELRDDCNQLIGAFETALIAHQVATDVIWDAVYAQCAILDEVVSRTLPEAMKPAWGKAPLQMTHFHNGDAGEHIFDRIVLRMQATTPELALLECYSTILGLGFQGCYTGSDEAARAALATALETKIDALRHLPGHHPDVDATEKRRPIWRCALSMLPPWIATMLAAAAIILLYLLLNHALDRQLYALPPLPSSTLHE